VRQTKGCQLRSPPLRLGSGAERRAALGHGGRHVHAAQPRDSRGAAACCALATRGRPRLAHGKGATIVEQPQRRPLVPRVVGPDAQLVDGCLGASAGEGERERLLVGVGELRDVARAAGLFSRAVARLAARAFVHPQQHRPAQHIAHLDRGAQRENSLPSRDTNLAHNADRAAAAAITAAVGAATGGGGVMQHTRRRLGG